MISVEGLSKSFGPVQAVHDLTFGAEPGSVTGFLGPNGAGKTTTLRILLGLVAPTAGRALIHGHPYADLPNPTTSVGAALEATDFHPGRSARNHLRVSCLSAGLPMLPALAIKGGSTSLLANDIPIILSGTVLATGLYALVGLGLGALIRNQIAAIVLAVVWVQLIEGILTFGVPKVGQWLPAGAVRAITRTTGFGGPNDELATLPAWGGAALLLAYGLAFAAIATLTTTRRDIT